MRFVFLLLFLLVFPASALAQETITSGIKTKLEKFDYNGVINLSDSILSTHEELSTSELIEINSLKGIAYFSVLNEDSARSAFIEILRLDKSFQPDPVTTSPKIISFFDNVKMDYFRYVKFDDQDKTIPIESITDSVSMQNPGILQIEKDLLVNSISRSVLLPGWGHLYLKQDLKGWIITGAAAASLGSMIYFITDANSKEKDYLSAVNPDLIQTKYDEFNSAYKIRNALILTYSAIWLYSQIDLLFFSDDRFNDSINSILFSYNFNDQIKNVEISYHFIF